MGQSYGKLFVDFNCGYLTGKVPFNVPDKSGHKSVSFCNSDRRFVLDYFTQTGLSLKFDGANDYCGWHNFFNPHLSIAEPNVIFFVFLMFKVDRYPAGPGDIQLGILHKIDNRYRGLSLYITKHGNIGFYMQDAADTIFYEKDMITGFDTNWHGFVCGFFEDSWRFSIDGDEYANGIDSHAGFPDTSHFSLGGTIFGTNCCDCTINEFAILRA
jgi:hypothetical protein